MKKLNKFALAASFLYAAGAANAQSSITVYGLMDVVFFVDFVLLIVV
jgi:predicted porin